MTSPVERVDVVGVGLNATDTIIRLPHFPTLDSKVRVLSSDIRAGGQVASAMVACQRWGLRTRYVGKVGDDWAADFQQQQFDAAGVESHLIREPNCASPASYILVDAKCGERTVLWGRDPRVELHPDDLRREWVVNASALLVDGHDTAAAAQAARWAREAGNPVVGDFDNLYGGVEVLLEYVDHIITSLEFPGRLIGVRDPIQALPRIHAKFKCHLTAATLGRNGVIAWDGVRFIYVPAFRVEAIDTTGAGDVFHGAYVYGIVRGMSLEENLEFSCAAAGLACNAVGARAGIADLEAIEQLIRTGERNEPLYQPEDLDRAANEVKVAG
ncbi:MAG TPA: PfkB family carbohydrate kinase [Candidatus Acidoferrales bacterium]|nr:PfkB family carbohydrate kinase [Candidatus Acidoferrales bacterium]